MTKTRALLKALPTELGVPLGIAAAIAAAWMWPFPTMLVGLVASAVALVCLGVLAVRAAYRRNLDKETS